MRNLATASALWALFGCGEQRNETYRTWADAQRAGAIERGWIPAFVPESARDIGDSHNLDTNAQTLRFIVPASDVQALTRDLQPIAPDDKIAAGELTRELGFDASSQVYVVCSTILNGALVVDKGNGRATFRRPVEWTNDNCSLQRHMPRQ